MKCPICGYENSDIEKACVNCGSEFIKGEEELELERIEKEKVANETQPTPPPIYQAPPVYQVPPTNTNYYAPPPVYQAPPVYQVPPQVPPVNQGYYAQPPVQSQYIQPPVQPQFVQPPYQQRIENPGASLGMASLIMGIIAFIICGITAIPSIITGIIGLSKSKDVGMKNTEAVAGICCSSVVLVIYGFSFLVGFLSAFA